MPKSHSSQAYTIPEESRSSLWTQRFLKRMIAVLALSSFTGFLYMPLAALSLICMTVFFVWYIIERQTSAAARQLAEARSNHKTATLLRTELQNSIMKHANSIIQEFRDAKARLSATRQNLKKLPGQLSKEIANLSKNAESRQRQAFLESNFIESGKIYGIGDGRVAVLRSYGIETAWDLSPQALAAIPNLPSFGPTLAHNLTMWRRTVESRFQFDPRLVNNTKARNDLELAFAQKTFDLQDHLSQGVEELQEITSRFHSEINAKMMAIRDLIRNESEAEIVAQMIQEAIDKETSIWTFR